MSLLQITEPGAPEKEELMTPAIGIDLGTTYSVVALSHNGAVEVLEDARGRTTVPSIVAYTPQGVVAGYAARTLLREGADDTIASVKRLMGQRPDESRGFNITEGSGMARLQLSDGREVTPVEVSAEILGHLRALAEEKLGEPVSKAVITVPAYFDDSARAATKDAAKLAGLEVLRLVNEPTAAALAYGLDEGAEGLFVIFDLGGGTFDVSILKLEKGVFQVLATGGDTALGGDDFDRAIAEHMLATHGTAELNSAEWNQLVALARDAKEALSERELTTLGWQNLEIDITREQFNGWIAPLVQRTLDICQQALEDAGRDMKEINGVVLVGGSTRVPLVREQVKAFFAKPALANIDPDLVVACGAALQAEALTHGGNHLLLDVLPLSLGLETMGGIVDKLIWRNTPIPITASQEFTTWQDGQAGMVVHVLQGERELVEQNRSLARFELFGIPPMPAGMARVKITFTVDADGLLSVTAREETTGKEQHVEVKPSYGLTPEEMRRMLEDSMRHAQGDIVSRLLAESRVEAQRAIAELQHAIAQDGYLLREEERDTFAMQIGLIEEAMAGDQRDSIDAAAARLHEYTQDFAERRMNRAIGKALQGKHVEDVNAP